MVITDKDSQFPDDLIMSSDLIMDRSVVIYGPSGTGKSKLIVDMMAVLKPHVDQVMVISPTDPANKTYSKGESVPTPLIHYKLTDELLETVWARQEMFAAVYSRANQKSVLQSLFNRLNLPDVKKILQQAEIAKSDKIREANNNFADKARVKSKTEEIEREYEKFFTLVYKRYISEHREKLTLMNLNQDESFALRYLDFNPRLLLIFDDCTADFKKLKTPRAKSIMGKLFFQNRWAFITVIIACHGDKNLDADLRNNAFMSIWTNKNSANVYFSHDANGFTKEMSRKVTEWSQLVFKGFQKLVFIREKDTFYKYTAAEHPNFQFGSAAVRSYCKKIKSEGLNMDMNNEFYQYFN